jgi:Fe-S cluster assembly protein SufD
MSSPIPLTAFEDRLLSEVPDTDLAELLRSRGLPGRRTETWKWSDLRGALRDEKPRSGAYVGVEAAAPVNLDSATVLTLKNGVPQAPRGVEPKPIVKNGEKGGSTYVVEDGLVVSFYEHGRDAEEAHPGEELSAIAALEPLVSVSILPGFQHKVLLRRLSDGEGSHGDNVFVTISEGARGTLIETHEVTGSPFVNSRTEIEIDAKARLDRVIVQPEAAGAVIVHSAVIRLDEAKGEEDAVLNQMTLALGAQLARHETRLTQLGAGRAKIDGLYRLNGQEHCDLTTHVTFEGEDSVCDQLVKGIAGGRARGVFQGKFLVQRGAQRTDAKMAHHALLLSKGAQINAKPELEIYADDVECAHGNTAGALDTDAIFYMRQRGVPEDEARKLLIDAFAAEVLDRIGDKDLRAAFDRLLMENPL